MVMNILIIITAFLIIVSKFFDCYTTALMSKKVTDKYREEKNPIGRWLMKKLGFHNAIWIVFIFTVIISLLVSYEVIISNDIYYSIAFIVLGAIISIIQFDVARTNYFQKQSFFTKFLSKIYGSVTI